MTYEFNYVKVWKFFLELRYMKNTVKVNFIVVFLIDGKYIMGSNFKNHSQN